MKKVLYIIGMCLIVGGIAVAICLLHNRKKKAHDMYQNCEEPEREKSSLTEPVYDDVKSLSIGSMYLRHDGAATIIRDSIETIRENVEVSENTNNDIDKVSVELDKMMNEG
ncbi:MAG: hypothetical protein MSA76_10125 [Clostridium sp.]|nr:hypothetical protein [Clostridium sp.]